jgi:hypothetical protein
MIYFQGTDKAIFHVNPDGTSGAKVSNLQQTRRQFDLSPANWSGNG